MRPGSDSLPGSANQPGCQETSGFLFSHRCGNPVLESCAACYKSICAKHTAPDPARNRRLCTSCARQALAQHPDASRSDFYSDDPYFYFSYHYPDAYAAYTLRSTPDPNDFTEGDEAVLDDAEAARRDGAAFEENMGAS